MHMQVQRLDLALIHAPPCIQGATWNQGCGGPDGPDPDDKVLPTAKTPATPNSHPHSSSFIRHALTLTLTLNFTLTLRPYPQQP